MNASNQNSSYTLVGVGEILWDLFPQGARFGGAPANFACHAAALGCRASIVSAVGQDELGERAIAALKDHRVETANVAQLADRPTGQVHIELDAGGKPSYRFGQEEAWDDLRWSDALGDLAAHADCVCFGTLGQRSRASRETIRRFVSTVPESSLRVFDINLRPPPVDPDVITQSLELANILKLNDEELPCLATQYGLTGSESDQLVRLAQRFDLRLIALTCGAGGAVLVCGGEIHRCVGTPVQVQDTVGAGDAFTAAMALRLLQGADLAEVSRFACQVAAFVCSQPGATPKLPEDLT